MATLRAGVIPPIWLIVHADEIDQPLLNQQLPFMRIVEELAHGQGRGATLPNAPEPVYVFWRQRVFQEEEP